MTALEQAREALEAARAMRDGLPHGPERSAVNAVLDRLDVAISAMASQRVAFAHEIAAIDAALSAQEMPAMRVELHDDESLTVHTASGGSCRLFRRGGGGVESLAYQMAMRLAAVPAAPKQAEAWKCEAVTADFSDGTITLHVKTTGWHVAAGEYLLIPPAAPQD